MIKYAKLENNQLEYAPINYNGVSNWIFDEQAVLAAGYLPVELHDKPDDGKLYKEEFEQLSDKIIQHWVEVIPTEEEIKQNRIWELKQLLAETDYVVIKIAEGVATQEDYAEVLANRKAWRSEINELEG